MAALVYSWAISLLFLFLGRVPCAPVCCGRGSLRRDATALELPCKDQVASHPHMVMALKRRRKRHSAQLNNLQLPLYMPTSVYDLPQALETDVAKDKRLNMESSNDVLSLEEMSESLVDSYSKPLSPFSTNPRVVSGIFNDTSKIDSIYSLENLGSKQHRINDSLLQIEGIYTPDRCTDYGVEANFADDYGYATDISPLEVHNENLLSDVSNIQIYEDDSLTAIPKPKIHCMSLTEVSNIVTDTDISPVEVLNENLLPDVSNIQIYEDDSLTAIPKPEIHCMSLTEVSNIDGNDHIPKSALASDGFLPDVYKSDLIRNYSMSDDAKLDMDYILFTSDPVMKVYNISLTDAPKTNMNTSDILTDDPSLNDPVENVETNDLLAEDSLTHRGTMSSIDTDHILKDVPSTSLPVANVETKDLLAEDSLTNAPMAHRGTMSSIDTNDILKDDPSTSSSVSSVETKDLLADISLTNAPSADKDSNDLLTDVSLTNAPKENMNTNDLADNPMAHMDKSDTRTTMFYGGNPDADRIQSTREKGNFSRNLVPLEHSSNESIYDILDYDWLSDTALCHSTSDSLAEHAPEINSPDILVSEDPSIATNTDISQVEVNNENVLSDVSLTDISKPETHAISLPEVPETELNIYNIPKSALTSNSLLPDVSKIDMSNDISLTDVAKIDMNNDISLTDVAKIDMNNYISLTDVAKIDMNNDISLTDAPMGVMDSNYLLADAPMGVMDSNYLLADAPLKNDPMKKVFNISLAGAITEMSINDYLSAALSTYTPMMNAYTISLTDTLNENMDTNDQLADISLTNVPLADVHTNDLLADVSLTNAQWTTMGTNNLLSNVSSTNAQMATMDTNYLLSDVSSTNAQMETMGTNVLRSDVSWANAQMANMDTNDVLADVSLTDAPMSNMDCHDLLADVSLTDSPMENMDINYILADVSLTDAPMANMDTNDLLSDVSSTNDQMANMDTNDLMAHVCLTNAQVENMDTKHQLADVPCTHARMVNINTNDLLADVSLANAQLENMDTNLLTDAAMVKVHNTSLKDSSKKRIDNNLSLIETQKIKHYIAALLKNMSNTYMNNFILSTEKHNIEVYDDAVLQGTSNSEQDDISSKHAPNISKAAVKNSTSLTEIEKYPAVPMKCIKNASALTGTDVLKMVAHTDASLKVSPTPAMWNYGSLAQSDPPKGFHNQVAGTETYNASEGTINQNIKTHKAISLKNISVPFKVDAHSNRNNPKIETQQDIPLNDVSVTVKVDAFTIINNPQLEICKEFVLTEIPITAMISAFTIDNNAKIERYKELSLTDIPITDQFNVFRCTEKSKLDLKSLKYIPNTKLDNELTFTDSSIPQILENIEVPYNSAPPMSVAMLKEQEHNKWSTIPNNPSQPQSKCLTKSSGFGTTAASSNRSAITLQLIFQGALPQAPPMVYIIMPKGPDNYSLTRVDPSLGYANYKVGDITGTVLTRSELSVAGCQACSP